MILYRGLIPHDISDLEAFKTINTNGHWQKVTIEDFQIYLFNKKLLLLPALLPNSLS
jgi:hypothetical protein